MTVHLDPSAPRISVLLIVTLFMLFVVVNLYVCLVTMLDLCWVGLFRDVRLMGLPFLLDFFGGPLLGPGLSSIPTNSNE
jgi:hypothetical protein